LVLVASLGGTRSGAGPADAAADALVGALATAVADGVGGGVGVALGSAAAVLAGGVSDFFSQPPGTAHAAKRRSEESHDFVPIGSLMARDCGRP
jgi:hypothetical protein